MNYSSAKAQEELRDKPHLPACYANYYGRVVERANALGWCLALHGSLRRDCDMLATPWVEGAASVDVLLSMIAEEVGGFVSPSATAKPLGRVAWTIVMGGPWLDISVLDPRVKQ